MKKYRVCISWKSGWEECVDFETKYLALVFMEALKDVYGIAEFHLCELKNNGWVLVPGLY